MFSSLFMFFIINNKGKAASGDKTKEANVQPTALRPRCFANSAINKAQATQETNNSN